MARSTELPHPRAARAWRTARSPRAAWTHFRDYLARHPQANDTSDAPVLDCGMCMHQSWTGPAATRLVLFEKLQCMTSFLYSFLARTRPESWSLATAVAPWGPNRFDVELLRAQTRRIRPPFGFVGDLDPHALHVYGALRAGGDLDAPNLEGRAFPLTWLGVDDGWIRRVQRTSRPLSARLIRMSGLEREYWEIVKRFFPGARGLVGEESYALLENGMTLEMDALSDVMVSVIRARLGRAE